MTKAYIFSYLEGYLHSPPIKIKVNLIFIISRSAITPITNDLRKLSVTLK